MTIWTAALEDELRWLILRYYRTKQAKIGALSCAGKTRSEAAQTGGNGT